MKMITLASTVLLLQEMKILPTHMYCDTCEILCPETFQIKRNFAFFRCSGCKTIKSIRDKTVLSNSNLQLKRFVGLIWSFSEDRGRTYNEVINGASMPSSGDYNDTLMSSKTLRKFYNYFCHIICKDYLKTKVKIGGPNDIIEIDESLCGKMKFGRGDRSKRRRAWVFGGVSRATGQAFAAICPNNKRTKASLYPIIQANIIPGSMIYIDGWRAYRKIPTLGFQHRWLDHTKYYVHPTDRSLNTNMIEGMWGTMKRFFPQAGPYNLEQNIMMFLWFKNKKAQGKSIFWSLVTLISENNTIEVFEEAQNIAVKEDGLAYAEDNQNEEEESEYESSGGETDDDDRDRLGFSCPFCQELFDETDLAKEHVIKHHSDEENRSVADDEDEDLYSCPFCALDFDNSIDARSHK